MGNFLKKWFGNFLGILFEFFGNSLGIVWQSLGSWLSSQFSIFKIYRLFKIHYCLHFQSQLIVMLIVYIFEERLFFTFQRQMIIKSSFNFQNQLIIYILKIYCLFTYSKSTIIWIFKVSWLFTFSKSTVYYIFKSADCLHFQSQLMAWSNIFLNVLLLIFRSIRKLHCDTKLWIWHEIMQFLTEGETRTGQGQQIKSLEALLRDRA